MISSKAGNKNLIVFLLAISFYGAALSLHRRFERPFLKITAQDSSINFNEDLLRIFSTGNKKLISDLIWVQTLLESDLEHYNKADMGNWMFLRFMTISVLDPLFYENYLYGGLYLSIVKDDLKGAAALYEKGMVHYPNDYNLIYNAGFNYYFELGDVENGLRLLDQIKDHPKSKGRIISVVNKLKRANGMELEDIYELVLLHYETTKDESLKLRLEDDLYSIRAEIDLKCLNQNGSNCSKKDSRGDFYVQRKNLYTTREPFVQYEIKKKKTLEK